MKHPLSDWMQQIDIQLIGNYSVAKAGTFQIGQAFGLNTVKTVAGLRIPNQIELNAAANLQAGANLMTNTELAYLCISLCNGLTGELDFVDLPLTSLVIDGTTEINAGPFYEVGFPIDWTKSYIKAVADLASPSSGFWNLSIQVYFTP